MPAQQSPILYSIWRLTAGQSLDAIAAAVKRIFGPMSDWKADDYVNRARAARNAGQILNQFGPEGHVFPWQVPVDQTLPVNRYRYDGTFTWFDEETGRRLTQNITVYTDGSATQQDVEATAAAELPALLEDWSEYAPPEQVYSWEVRSVTRGPLR
jgi:hypothetical protein